MALNLHTIDPTELLPLPEVPESESYGARDDEEKRVLQLVKEGLESGPVIPVDDAFIACLRSRITSKI